MPDQLFTYYIENPLVIISINSGSLVRVMDFRLDIEVGVMGKGGTKKEGGGKRGGQVGEVYCAAEFCGLCACLGVFLLL
jgi:hypothetical protein